MLALRPRNLVCSTAPVQHSLHTELYDLHEYVLWRQGQFFDRKVASILLFIGTWLI